MKSEKRRSTLRKLPVTLDVGPTDSRTHLKRRISFSGKNSVRVFSGEEEPKAWNNSYEISDNINANETATNICSTPLKNVQNATKVFQENTKNDRSSVAEKSLLHFNQEIKNRGNLSTSSNMSVLNSSREVLNVLNYNQNTKLYQIENSVDITLYGSEKNFVIGKNKNNDQSAGNFYSFSLEEYEKEARSNLIGEKTIDFMGELRNNLSNEIINDSKSFSAKVDTLLNEYMNEENTQHDSACSKSENFTESHTVHMDETLSISSNEQIFAENININKRNTINQATAMQFSPNNDKENVNPFSVHIANKTQNKSCEMEFEEEISPFCQANEQIESSPRSLNKTSNKNISIQIITSPNISAVKSLENIRTDNINQRVSTYFNQSIDVADTTTATISESKGAIPKVKSRPTINFNQPLETSLPNFKNNLSRRTQNLNEDMIMSPIKLSPNSRSFRKSNISGSIRKHDHQSKVVVRRICIPVMNKTKNLFGLEYQQRYRKQQEKDETLGVGKDNATVTDKAASATEVDKTLSSSRDSVKKFSFSSPLIPSNIQEHRKTMYFQDVDIPVSFDDSLYSIFKKDNLIHSHATLVNDVAKGKNNRESRYSQADDVMLDNTSFLTRAKLGDETVSRNSSKKDVNQTKDADDILVSNLRNQILCDKENNTLSSMLENCSLTFTHTVANKEDCKNFMNLNDTMDISNVADNTNICSLKTLRLQTDECKKHLKQITCFNKDYENDGDLDIHKGHEKVENRKTLMFNQSIILEDSFKNASQPKSLFMEFEPNVQKNLPGTDIFHSNTTGKTLHFEESIIDEKFLCKKATIDESVREIDMDSSRSKPISKSFSFNNEHKSMQIEDDDEGENSELRKLPTEASSSPKGNDQIISCLISARKTLYFNNEILLDEGSNSKDKVNIETHATDECFENSEGADKPFICNKTPHEKTSMRIEENLQENLFEAGIYYSNPIKKTLHFDSKIPLSEKSVPNDQILLEKVNIETQENVQVQNVDLHSSNLNPTRKTLYFTNEIPSQNVSMEITEQVEAGKPKTNIDHDNKTRKTLYFNNEISLEDVSNTTDQKSTKSEKFHTDIPNYNPSRKTLYFDNEIYQLDETLQPTDQKLRLSGAEDIYVALSAVASENVEEAVYLCPSKHQLTIRALETNKNEGKQLGADEIKMSTRRESVYTPESMDLTLDGEELNKNEIETVNAVGDTKSNSALDDLQPLDNISNAATKVFEENNYISLDQSFKPAETFVFSKSIESSNAAKMILSRQMTKSKLSNKMENISMTPVNKKHFLTCATPRQSLLEFNAFEKQTQEEDENTNKRPSSNITPVLSVSKKRQTFVDSVLEDLEQTKKNESDCTKSFMNDNVMEMSDIVQIESALQTATNEKKSRIPIPVTTGVKTNKSLSSIDISSNSHNEIDAQLDRHEEELMDSIQLMRKATSFAQREDRTIVQHEVDANFVPVSKIATFEGNPITISDVSVFFEAQRKSNTDITQNEMTLPVDKSDSHLLNPKQDKRLKNHFVNLTLEDLEKTRLSLVELSYEEGRANVVDVEQEQLPSNVTNISERRSRRNSINYLRNTSLVCRKCRRCQETLLNESSLTTSETFVLPELPPLPDVGLDRLRRLRKGPTIESTFVVLERLALDLTIKNDNISNDDSQIKANLDELNDENSAVTKFIRKYEEDVMSFERCLLAKQPEAPSKEMEFVLRLDNLLRKNSTNWIFDYQMQFRGILLFTHKKTLTFTLFLTYDEIDPFGQDIQIKSVKLEKSHVPKKNWKPIDFFLDFQLKLNLPFNLQWLCKGSDEVSIFQMLQEIDKICLDTLKMGNALQLVCCSNHASILRDGGRTIVRKVVRKVVENPNNNFKYVEKKDIKVELLNLKKLSFKDILSPRLHHFREEIHLLPTGLQFLQEFLRNPINYLKDD